ncbi:MAG: hypothetical protein K6E12_00405 [Saccharofermentans sp.]|nr:hypothetical protein [Saccharofermentans sp.]
MNEKEFMNITNGIDERYVAEYQNTAKVYDLNRRRKLSIGIAAAALVAVMVPIGVFAVAQITHRDKVSIYYSEEGVQMLEESLLANGFTVNNGSYELTVDVEMCDGNFTQGVYTVTALTDEAREHLQSINTKLVYADTGEWIYPVGGGSESAFGDALSEDQISIQFSYPVNNSYVDASRPIRVVFFEYVETGETDGYGNEVVEDYTYYEGICFDLLTEPNVQTKTLRAEDGTEITLNPYGVSQLGKSWEYPEGDEIPGEEVSDFAVIATDGGRTEILSEGNLSSAAGFGTGVVNGITITGAYGSGNFTIGFGTVLNVDNISGVEINGVVYTG